jgi:hypothetical protein
MPLGGGAVLFVLFWLLQGFWPGFITALVWAGASFLYLRTHYKITGQAARKLQSLMGDEKALCGGTAYVLTKDNKELTGAYAVTKTQFWFDRGVEDEEAPEEAELCLDFADVADIKVDGRYLQLAMEGGEKFDFRVPQLAQLLPCLKQAFGQSRVAEDV